MKEISLNSSQNELKYILIKNGWMLEEDLIIHVETPGAGNMNVVLRLLLKRVVSYSNSQGLTSTNIPKYRPPLIALRLKTNFMN